MSPDKIFVLAGSIGLIGLIYWFFLGKKGKAGEVVENARIKVQGGYSPALIKVPVGKTVKLTFTRTDPTDCLEELVFPDLKIKKSLPLGEAVEVDFKIDNAGEYKFHCGMNMFSGKVVAV